MNVAANRTTTVSADAAALWSAPQTWVTIGAVSAALLFAYRGALTALVGLWDNSPMYSYGFTVPFVSGYLLWSRRDALRRLTPRPSWTSGGLVLLLAVGMTVAARAGGIQILEQLAFLVALTAAVLLLFGAAFVRVAWAALAYLLLMIPLWDAFTEPLHEPFQQRSAAIGVWLLHLIGIPAFREGTFIALPNMQIEVARVCSGVNYLVAVIAMGLPLGYVFLRDNWRRLGLLTVAVAIAALSNGLRVALICALAYYEVGSPLHGPFHVLHGLFVAGVGYVVLFAGLRVLSPNREHTDAKKPTTSMGLSGPTSSTSWRFSLAATVILLVIFAATGSSLLARSSRPVTLEGALDTFPTELGAWSSDPVSRLRHVTARSQWPGADTEISRRYRRADGAVVDLYLGYFASQEQRRELVTHLSSEMHSRAELRRIEVSGQTGFQANYVAADRQDVVRMFWYEIDARPETNKYIVKARTLWNAICGARSNGAVVVLSTHAAGQAAPDRILGEIAGLVQNALASRLPGSRPRATQPTGAARN
jgi:EpsI family protein